MRIIAFTRRKQHSNVAQHWRAADEAERSLLAETKERGPRPWPWPWRASLLSRFGALPNYVSIPAATVAGLGSTPSLASRQ
jgi:hypothetical protein